MRSTRTSSTPAFAPHLLKLLAHQQQFSGKEYLHGAYFSSHPPPPNAVATNLPRHLLGNGLSKLNTEKTFSPSNDKVPDQELVNEPPKKRSSLEQSKDASTFDQWLQPPAGSIIQGPPCLSSDSCSADLRSETVLSSGERISCFLVGGENRLCLPEILNSILKDFSLPEINSACERLHIYCSRCTPEQLDILKGSDLLPRTAPSCGLITQTDAERLCATLLQSRSKGQLRSLNSPGVNPSDRLYSFQVQHKCFGRCAGTLYPSLYVSPHAACIQCESCQALFAAKTFVSHGHKSEENRICHWGFNSENWRAYLKVRSSEDRQAREALELFKEKFSKNNHKRPTAPEPSSPSISHFTDFSPNGIGQILHSTVTSSHARRQLLTYISELQQAALNSEPSNETVLLRRENELLRERLSRYQQAEDLDCASGHEQPKYFDRKRRLLAGEHGSDGGKRSHQPQKKACLEEIVDSLNHKAAQAEQDDEEKLMSITEHTFTPSRHGAEDDDDEVDIEQI